MFNFKYDLLGRPLELKKTHDFCVSESPELAVVFIHGLASDSKTFSKALKYLEGTTSLKNVRFITFDLLGSGESYKSDKLNYDYKDQLSALENSLAKLKLDIPLVLVGHSLGTLIVTRYASIRKKAARELILLSPPIYTEKDLDNPAFEIAMKGFKDAVSVKNHAILKEKSFNSSIEKIVKNRKNYQTLANITTKTVLIYGDLDKIIASYNISKILKENPEYISAIRTPGHHGVSHEKYNKIRENLEEVLNA